MMIKHHALAFFVAAALVPAAYAGVIDRAQQAGTSASAQTWSAWGGEIGVRWNRDLLTNLGVNVDSGTTAKLATQDFRQHEWFAVRESAGLQFTVSNSALREFTGGSVQMRGGFVLKLRDGSTIDMRDLTLRVRANDSRVLDIVSGDGQAWFYSDRLMFRLSDDERTLMVKAADVRISERLANRLGAPESAGWEVADIAMNTQIFVQGDDLEPNRVCTPYPWPGVAVPGVPGAVYQADLFMQTFSIDPVGCQGCDGTGGNDGLVAYAPSSTLRNNVNDGSLQATIAGDPLGTSTALYTANVAWHEMFSGNSEPYDNDQHPFLIWNLYRTNADGSIEQIGRSGVKHAFLTINSGCLDSCEEFNSLGRGCGDTYGTGNNDSSSDMGPRSEIVPATGTWGRCGSIWDVGCSGGSHNNGNDSWTQRLKTRESQVDPAANAGATYMFESWYIARDDINIYNSMATITGTPHFAGSQWSFSGQSNYKLGPAIDRWVSPTAPPANAKNTELAAPEGHAKVAVKATNIGGGNWRYDYVVQNLDFARAIIQPPQNGPDPRVVSNRGFDNFSVPIPAGSVVTATSFRDGDLVATNDWKTVNSGSRVTWNNGGLMSSATSKPKPSLDWGTMFTFSITVNKAPVAGDSTLHVANAGSPSQYTVATLVPGT
jgi:hypothetical protein